LPKVSRGRPAWLVPAVIGGFIAIAIAVVLLAAR
jgi:hypothetical protein